MVTLDVLPKQHHQQRLSCEKFWVTLSKKKEGKRRKVLSYRMHKKPRKTTTYEGILLFKVTQWNLVYKDIFE